MLTSKTTLCKIVLDYLKFGVYAMHTLTDSHLAELCGMTSNNLRMTYKKNPDPTKQRVYEFLRLGAEAWIERQEKSVKTKELVEFLKQMEPIEIDVPIRRSRAIASLD